MARFLRFLCALAALPFAWALAFVFMDAFRIMPMSGDAFLPPGALWLAGGFLLFFVLWIIRMAPLRVYVLGHELTHALCGLCFGAIPTNLRLVALIVRFFVSPLPCSGAWLFAVGFTLGLHVCFTLRAILQEQPDLQEYGYVFSYVLTWIFTIAGVIAWIVCPSEVTWGAVWGRLLVRSARAYAAVGRGCLWIYESVRTLPFLQG